MISAHDATAQVCAELELSEALSLLTATLDSTADGILVVDTAGKITSFNRRFAEIWQLPEDILTSGDATAALHFVIGQMANPETFQTKVEELYAKQEIESFDTIEFKDGRVVERESRPQRVDGKTVGRVWSFRDVTDQKRLEEELAYRAFHDSLTGLANKALFQDRLDHALARLERTGSHLAVLFLDLDDFKTVNDSLGHGEGDQLLRRVATTLVGCLGVSDTAARLGGDEFAVLIEDVQSQNTITALAQRILDALRPPVRLAGKSVSSAVSIGIAFNEPGTTSEQLLRNADIAMYKAKALGKDRFEVFADEMHASVLARLELEEELREAIREGDLAVHYQPIMDLNAHSVVGLEALVRWSHPTRGLVGPSVFVPLAEELGLIGEIDSFVLRSACRQARQWRDEYLGRPDLVISVNVSARQLVDPSLADRIAAEVDECAFDPRSLILEITESAMLTDNDVTVDNLTALRALGDAHRAGRLRHGLLVVLAPRPAADRYRQDRQVLRAGAGLRRATGGAWRRRSCSWPGPSATGSLPRGSRKPTRPRACARSGAAWPRGTTSASHWTPRPPDCCSARTTRSCRCSSVAGAPDPQSPRHGHAGASRADGTTWRACA